MLYLKPIFYTLLYILFNELIASWILLVDSSSLAFLINYDRLINGLILMLSIIVFTYLTNNKSFNLPQSTSSKWYLISITLGVSFVFLQSPLNWIFNFFSTEKHSILFEFNGFSKFANLNLLASILFVPIAEELFFREFIQKNLQKSNLTFITIGLSSLLFALIHLPYERLFFGFSPFSFHHAYITLFGGLIIGLVYYKSKSIGPAIVLHMAWNLMVVIV